MRMLAYRLLSTLLLILLTIPVFAGEARKRWERMNQIRQDKFDLVLPEVMRENDIDMWIVMRREGYDDPLTPDLGGGYVGTTGFYVFTDRGGDRIERAALGISGYLIEAGGGYDIFAGEDTLRDFVAERDPKRIGVNISRGDRCCRRADPQRLVGDSRVAGRPLGRPSGERGRARVELPFPAGRQ